MPEHLRPLTSKLRPLAALAVAVVVALLVLTWSQLDGDDPPVPQVRPTDAVSTAPTVLAEEIVAPTARPGSPPASPAPSLLPDRPVVTSTTSSRPPPTLIPPLIVTSPIPPRTTPTSSATTTTDPAAATTVPSPGDA